MKILLAIVAFLSFEAFAQEASFNVTWDNTPDKSYLADRDSYSTESPSDKVVMSKTLFKNEVGLKIISYKDIMKKPSVQAALKELNQKTGGKAEIDFSLSTLGELKPSNTSLLITLIKDPLDGSATNKYNRLTMSWVQHMDSAITTPEEFEKGTIEFIKNELKAIKAREDELIQAVDQLKDFSMSCNF